MKKASECPCPHFSYPDDDAYTHCLGSRCSQWAWYNLDENCGRTMGRCGLAQGQWLEDDSE